MMEQDMQEQIDAASAVLDQLEARKADADRRLTGIDEERSKLSYAALTGDTKAQKRLATLNAEAVTARLDLENAVFAIEEARRRLQVTQEDAAREATWAKARAARAKLGEFRAHGAKLQSHLREFVLHYQAFQDLAGEVRQLDVGGPSHSLMNTGIARAIQSMLLGTRLESTTVPPSQRTTIAALVDRWAEDMDRRIARILGEAEAEPEELPPVDQELAAIEKLLADQPAAA